LYASEKTEVRGVGGADYLPGFVRCPVPASASHHFDIRLLPPTNTKNSKNACIELSVAATRFMGIGFEVVAAVPSAPWRPPL
jgi:hypothetical protein